MDGRWKTPPRQMTGSEFMARFAEIYEDSPWVAERAFNRGLSEDTDTVTGLWKLLETEVALASGEERLALLRAHPELSGRAALAGELTEASTKEQAGAGLDRLSSEELAEIQSLNRRYRERFSFPFIMAVKGADKHVILEAFRLRLEHSLAEEFKTAITQVGRIAKLRLSSIAESEGSNKEEE